MKPLTESRARALIDAHFERRISPEDERVLRAHLEVCGDCVKVYDAHLLFERITGDAAQSRERLAAGLGFKPTLRRTRAPWIAGIGFGGALAAAFLLHVAGARQEGARQEHEFAARGVLPDESPRTLAYALSPTRKLEVSDRVRATDQLAFAYTNPTGFRHLLVFGVDEHRHVYWYHPAWRSRDEHPRALAIQDGPAARELPDAVRHDLDGHALTVYSVFLDEDMPVERIEQLVAAARSTDEPLPLPGAYQQRLSLVVERGP
jgi:hypothetical protein